MFNTLKYAKMLESVGFTRDQAETSIKILVETMEDKLATKQDLKDHQIATQQDLKDHQVATRQDMNDHRVATRQEFKNLEFKIDQDFKEMGSKIDTAVSDLRHLIEQSEAKSTIRMGTMIAAAIAILTAIQKLT